jgi:hypothetical protein
MRRLTIIFVVALAATGCANLGLGEAGCVQSLGEVSSVNIMNLQAVPTAKYTPCLDELRLGWDSVDWFAEDGRAGIEIIESFNTFLTATVTESCDVSNAIEVQSGYPDIRRFDDIEFQSADIQITIIPTGQQPLSTSRALTDSLAGIEIDDRPVTYIIDSDIEQPVSTRAQVAQSQTDYVWIIDELDAEEGTVQLRSNNTIATGHGLQPQEALNLIEDVIPDVFYRGNWDFTFEGGCITSEFDAKGTLAETVASDAQDAIGFYPAQELRQYAEDAGFNIG